MLQLSWTAAVPPSAWTAPLETAAESRPRIWQTMLAWRALHARTGHHIFCCLLWLATLFRIQQLLSSAYLSDISVGLVGPGTTPDFLVCPENQSAMQVGSGICQWITSTVHVHLKEGTASVAQSCHVHLEQSGHSSLLRREA